jgi:HEAT repeat protein
MLTQRDALWALAALALAAAPAARGEDPAVIKLRVTALARQLDGGTAEDKIKAAGELAKLGADGRPAAKALTRLCVDPSARVSQAAQNALEKVWPELYEAGMALLKEKDEALGKSPKHEEACQIILKLGDDAPAGVPFLLQYLRGHLEKDDDFFGVNRGLAAVDAVSHLAPADPAFHKILVAAGAATNVKHANRALALRTLGDLGESNTKVRRGFIPVLKQALTAMPTTPGMRTHPRYNLDQVRRAAVEALGKFGKDARAELPALKKIKANDPVDAVRKSAADAVAKIEGDR